MAVRAQFEPAEVNLMNCTGSLCRSVFENLERRSYFSAGTLDLSTLAQWGSHSTSAFALAVSGDKTLVAGYVSGDNGDDFAIARFNADGTLDSTFGQGGWAIVDFGSTFDQACAIAVDAQGHIVVAGQTSVNGSFDFAVARLDSSGALDSTFGSGGKVTIDFEGQFDQATALVITGDDKILVGGSAMKDWVSGFGLVKLNEDGSLDSGFAQQGKALVVWNDIGAEATALAMQADGKIVQAGFVSNLVDPNAWTIDTDMAVLRYNADGSLDTSFGVGGKVSIDFGRDDDHAQALAIATDGKILVAGYSADTSGPADFALARLDATGALDQTFGAGGKVVTDFVGAQDRAFAIALRDDGKILVAGSSDQGPSRDFALVKYNSDGSLDSDFASGGKLVVHMGGNDCAMGVALDGESILVAGTVTMTDGNRWVGLAKISDETPTPEVVEVVNAAPVASLSGATFAVSGFAAGFLGSFSDADLLDTHEVSWDFGDGSSLAFGPGEGDQGVSHVYAASGTYVVTFTVRDAAGATSSATLDVVVGAAGIVMDGDLAVLQVSGTEQRDWIKLKWHKKSGKVELLFNGKSQGLFQADKVIVQAGAGNDFVQADEKMKMSVALYGGDGNDVLIGGAGNDLLDGGNGNDILHGRKGTDSIFAGAGKDHYQKHGGDVVDDPDAKVKKVKETKKAKK